jgi:hypothetical protein
MFQPHHGCHFVLQLSIITTNITTKNGECYDVAMTMNSTMSLSNFVELNELWFEHIRFNKVQQFTSLIIVS